MATWSILTKTQQLRSRDNFPPNYRFMQRADLEIVITLSDGTSFNGIRTYILRGCHSLRILRYLTILNLLLVTSYSPPQRCVTLHMIVRCHGQRCCVAADWQLERGELTARHHRVRVMLADSCHTFTATTKYPLDIYILFIRNGAYASSPSNSPLKSWPDQFHTSSKYSQICRPRHTLVTEMMNCARIV